MRRPLIACVRTADTLLGTRLSYTLVNGVRVPSDAQLGQPYAAPLSSGNEDGGTFTVTGTVPPGARAAEPGHPRLRHRAGLARDASAAAGSRRFGRHRPSEARFARKGKHGNRRRACCPVLHVRFRGKFHGTH